MSELPPDPSRLRAILAHLEQQLASIETVATYLRLQRDTVQAALSRTGTRPRPRPALPAAQPRQQVRQAPPPQTRQRMKLRPGTFMLEPKIKPDHPRPAYIHVGGCNAIEGPAAECTQRQAELSLTQEAVGAQACPTCRPDMALGIAAA